MRLFPLLVLGLLLLTGCADAPPDTLGGFRLGMTRDEVMEAVRSRGGFSCRLRGSRPPLTACEGGAEEGRVAVLVRGDSLVSVELQLAPAGDRPRRRVRRFADPFGEPAWRDRPYPGGPAPVDGYHTLWLDQDTSRAVAVVCAGEALAPPCTARLTGTSPRQVEAQLDSLLGIRR